MEYKKETEAKLRKLLSKLRADYQSLKNASNIQRVIHELRIYHIEQEIKNLEYREARNQLTETRDRYAELYDFAPIAYVTFDSHAHITDLNLAAAKMFGQERELVLNKPISHWLSEEDSQNFLQHLYQVSFSRKKVITEIKLRRLDQKQLYVRLESIAVRDIDGVATRCQTAIIDITETKRTEDILRVTNDDLESRVEERTAMLEAANKALKQEVEQHALANEQLKQSAIVFENTADGIVILDANYRIITVNNSFCNMTGYSADELTGMNPAKLVTSRTDSKYYQVMMEALAEAGHWKGEIWFENKSGEHIPVWENINNVKDAENNVTHYVAIVTDISALKETEAKCKKKLLYLKTTGSKKKISTY